MKKILFILISIPFLFLVACTGEEKEIYSGNSNERLTEEECVQTRGASFGSSIDLIARYWFYREN